MMTGLFREVMRELSGLCESPMPGHTDSSPLHRCQLPPHADNLHHAPTAMDPTSQFARVFVSWHDPLPPPTEEYTNG